VELLFGFLMALPPAPPPPQHSTWRADTFAGQVQVDIAGFVYTEESSEMALETEIVSVELPDPDKLLAVTTTWLEPF
jgi:hypothetical protein